MGRPSGGSGFTSSRCGLLRPAVEASIVKKPSRLAQILPGGRAFMMSSALTWPGEPGGSFAMARLTWVCAILKSPAFMNACAEASSAIAMLPLRPVLERLGGLGLALGGVGELPDGLVEKLRVTGRDEGVAEHGANGHGAGRCGNRAAERPDRFAGATALEQRLSLHLLEIRVSGLLLDEAVDQRQCLGEPGAAVGEHGAGIAGRRRGVVAGIARSTVSGRAAKP